LLDVFFLLFVLLLVCFFYICKLKKKIKKILFICLFHFFVEFQNIIK